MLKELYTRLPTEASKPGHVGKLLRTLYGTRDAANAWDEFFNNSVIEDGYEIVLASPCSYYHRAQDSHGWRRGDDLVFEGEESWRDEMQKDGSNVWRS